MLALKSIPKADWKKFAPNTKPAQKKLHPKPKLEKAILKACFAR